MRKLLPFFAAPLALLCSACLSPEEGRVHADTAAHTTDSGQSQVPEAEFQNGALLALSVPSAQVLNLGVTQSVQLRLQAASNFSGTVNLTLEREELDAIDVAGNVRVSVVPSQVTLSPGQSVLLTVTFTVQTLSRSFDDSHLHLVATEAGAAAPAFTTREIPLSVKPVIEITHGSPTLPESSSQSGTLSFRAHAAGLTVRFIDVDSAAQHRVHASGAIVHQGTIPLTQKLYEVVIPSGARTSASWYCHNHESSTQARTLSFNNN